MGSNLDDHESPDAGITLLCIGDLVGDHRRHKTTRPAAQQDALDADKLF